jgi:DNA-binding transcriptional LysR family regulator
MELRQLRYFVAVAEEQHFGRAAKRLGVAQPALSRQMQRLEKELGGALLVRTPQGTRVTQAGQVLLDEARQLVSGVDAAMRRVRSATGTEPGQLRSSAR